MKTERGVAYDERRALISTHGDPTKCMVLGCESEAVYHSDDPNRKSDRGYCHRHADYVPETRESTYRPSERVGLTFDPVADLQSLVVDDSPAPPPRPRSTVSPSPAICPSPTTDAPTRRNAAGRLRQSLAAIRSISLDGYPQILRMHQYCEVMQQGERTVRREIAFGLCRVQPCMVRPYRWARVDIEAFLSSTTVTSDRRAHRELNQIAGGPR